VTGDQQRDACPVCGANVGSVVAYDVGAGPSDRPTQQQSRDCPTCHTRLRRTVGNSWTAVARDWRATVRGGSYWEMVHAFGEAGMLVRASSVTPTEGGLGLPEFDVEVSAVTEQDARDAVAAVARAAQVADHPGRARLGSTAARSHQWPDILAHDLQVTGPRPSFTSRIVLPRHESGFGPHKGSPSRRNSWISKRKPVVAAASLICPVSSAW